MSEQIEVTSTEIKTRKPVQLGSAYHRKLEILAEAQHRPMTNLVEYWIEKAWQETHTQPISIQEELERR